MQRGYTSHSLGRSSRVFNSLHRLFTETSCVIVIRIIYNQIIIPSIFSFIELSCDCSIKSQTTPTRSTEPRWIVFPPTQFWRRVEPRPDSSKHIFSSVGKISATSWPQNIFHGSWHCFFYSNVPRQRLTSAAKRQSFGFFCLKAYL